MTVIDLIYRLFNGNETARAMRYSSFVIISILIAGYYGVIDRQDVVVLISASTGYIFGKARAETHVIEPKDRRETP